MGSGGVHLLRHQPCGCLVETARGRRSSRGRVAERSPSSAGPGLGGCRGPVSSLVQQKQHNVPRREPSVLGAIAALGISV